MIAIHEYAGPSPEQMSLIINGMRNSWESWSKGDSNLFIEADVFTLGDNDKALAQRLTKLGPDHGKYLRQIPIVVDLTAPNYFWVEVDTYKIGTTRNSTSKMHILGKEPFNESMFSWEDMNDSTKGHILVGLNYLRDEWIASGKRKGPEIATWRAMVQAIPDSWNYRCALSLNYQVLRSMYHARKNHRLSEWRYWCDFTAKLPYGELITYE